MIKYNANQLYFVSCKFHFLWLDSVHLFHIVELIGPQG